MTEYTQGICEDGAAILKDGQPITIEEILAELQEGAIYKDRVGRTLAYMVYSFFKDPREVLINIFIMLEGQDKQITMETLLRSYGWNGSPKIYSSS